VIFVGDSTPTTATAGGSGDLGRQGRRPRVGDDTIGHKVGIAPFPVYKVQGHYITVDLGTRLTVVQELVQMIHGIVGRRPVLVVGYRCFTFRQNNPDIGTAALNRIRDPEFEEPVCKVEAIQLTGGIRLLKEIRPLGDSQRVEKNTGGAATVT